MQECWDPIITVVIPLTILNLITTTFIVIGSRYLEPILFSNPRQSKSLSQTEIHNSQSSSSFASDENSDDSSTEDLHKELLQDSITDADMIAAVNDSFSTDTHQLQISLESENRTSQAEISRNELSTEQTSLESMAGTLISVTKQIAGTLDTANHIPNDKKQELANILKGVPEFITKIVDMDDDELGAILDRRIIPKGTGLSSQKPDCIEDHKRESEYLMQTLESLKNDKITTVDSICRSLQESI